MVDLATVLTNVSVGVLTNALYEYAIKPYLNSNCIKFLGIPLLKYYCLNKIQEAVIEIRQEDKVYKFKIADLPEKEKKFLLKLIEKNKDYLYNKEAFIKNFSIIGDYNRLIYQIGENHQYISDLNAGRDIKVNINSNLNKIFFIILLLFIAIIIFTLFLFKDKKEKNISIKQENITSNKEVIGYVENFNKKEINYNTNKQSLDEKKSKLILTGWIGDNFEKLDRKYIVGRDKEIDDIKNLLKRFKGVNIYGTAGVGKSTLAKIILNEIDRNYQYKIVFILSNEDTSYSLKKKIVKEIEKLLEKLNVKNYLKNLKTLDEKYQEALKILNDKTLFKGKKLVIVDNILSFSKRGKGQVDIRALKELFSLDNTQFILTSRQKLEGFPYIANYHLEPLSLEDSLKLFARYYQYKPDEEERIKELLELIQRNTFFIEVLAKTLATGNITLDELLEKVRKLELPKVFIYDEGDRELKEYYEQLLKLSWEYLNEELRLIMKKIGLLPAGIPIDLKFLERYLANIKNIKGKINGLINRGFLEWEEEGKSIIMHQIVKDYLLYVEKPRYEEINEQIDFILDNYLTEDLANPQKAIEIWRSGILEIIEGIGNSLGILGIKNENIGAYFNQVGLLYHHLGEHDKAEEYYKKALEIKEKVLPPDHPDLALSYNNLALLYKDKGEYDKAEEYYKKALEIFEKVLPPDHPSLATSYNNLAGLYQAKGEYDKAEEYYKKALEIEEKVLPPDHPSLAISYNNLALLYQDKGEYDKAEEYYKKALEIEEKVLPPDHPSLAISYNNLAGLYQAKGEYDKAEKYYKKALEILRKSVGENHPNYKIIYENYLSLKNMKGKFETNE